MTPRLLEPMPKRTAARLGEVDQVVGDKAFVEAAQRRACATIGAAEVIPARSSPASWNSSAYAPSRSNSVAPLACRVRAQRSRHTAGTHAP
jgi:hypothetical protein